MKAGMHSKAILEGLLSLSHIVLVDTLVMEETMGRLDLTMGRPSPIYKEGIVMLPPLVLALECWPSKVCMGTISGITFDVSQKYWSNNKLL